MPNLTVKVIGLDKVVKNLERNAAKAETVIKRTVSDMRNRVPGYVAAEVSADYNIKKGQVMPAKKLKNGKWKKTAGSVRVKGETLETVTVVYEGEMLTPVRFDMNPKKPKKAKAAKKKRKHRRNPTPKPPAEPITAEIKRGQRKKLHPSAFLGKNNGGGYIPFRRTGKSRYPIESIKTISVPQMVEGKEVYPRIQEKINDQLQKRLDHHLKQYLEKN